MIKWTLISSLRARLAGKHWIRFIKPYKMLPALGLVTIHSCFVHLHKAVYKLTGQKKCATTIFFFRIKSKKILNLYDWQLRSIGEALTCAEPPTEPDVLTEPPPELLMLLLQHWRLNKQTTGSQDPHWSNKLCPETCYLLWKWNKLKFQLNSSLHSPSLHETWLEKKKNHLKLKTAQSLPAAPEC